MNANEENSPPVSKEELRKYQSSPGGIKVAGWVKALFTKAWFAGVICFFFIWGVGMYVPNHLDLMVVTGAALGLALDLLENKVCLCVASNSTCGVTSFDDLAQKLKK